MKTKKSLIKVPWLALIMVAALGACTIPKGGGTDTGPPT
jgi:hypothetical protein